MRQSTKQMQEAMIEALKRSFGVVTTAAKAVGINPDTHYLWLKKYPAYKEKVEAVENIPLDFAETELFKAIKGGNMKAIMFYLRTKGKGRGYTERQEQQTNGNVEIICTLQD